MAKTVVHGTIAARDARLFPASPTMASEASVTIASEREMREIDVTAWGTSTLPLDEGRWLPSGARTSSDGPSPAYMSCTRIELDAWRRMGGAPMSPRSLRPPAVRLAPAASAGGHQTYA